MWSGLLTQFKSQLLPFLPWREQAERTRKQSCGPQKATARMGDAGVPLGESTSWGAAWEELEVLGRGRTQVIHPDALGRRCLSIAHDKHSGGGVGGQRRKVQRQVWGERSHKLPPLRHCLQVNFKLFFLVKKWTVETNFKKNEKDSFAYSQFL